MRNVRLRGRSCALNLKSIMQTVETEAIVLSTRDHGESDRLINFLSKSSGRLRGFAKGARRSHRRFVHSFEPFSVVELKYLERKGGLWIESSKLLEPFLDLRRDLERWSYAALATEIVLELAPEGEPGVEVFPLLKETYLHLSDDREPLNVLLLFLFRFLDVMGYLPALDGCTLCGKPVDDAIRWVWTVDRGIFTCPDHGPRGQAHISLDLGTVTLIRRARELPLERVWRLYFTRDKRSPLLEVLLEWVREQIRKDLSTLRMLRQLGASSASC